EFSEQDETFLEQGCHPRVVPLSPCHMAKIAQHIRHTPLVVQVPKEGQALLIELRCLLIVALTAQHFAQTIERQSLAPPITSLAPQRQAFLQQMVRRGKITLGGDYLPQAKQCQSQTPLVPLLPKECHALL